MTALPAGVQSPLAPHGVEAAHIAELVMVLGVGAAVIFTVVLILAGWALREHRPHWMQGRGLIIGGGIVFPLTVLSALFAYALGLGSTLASTEPPALRLHIVGEMWWWRVHYLDASGQVDFATANEIHLPAGRSVEIALESADVIHSFWVPGLSGMLDMIPGRVNRLRITPHKRGVLRGQCTEFCGMQHARMAFQVVVGDPAEFDRWTAAQRAHARAPQTELQSHGTRLFELHCAACHAVRGTPAAGVLGPDLTHVGSRMALVAGMLPNNVGTIAGWIASSQHLKPGNRMPSFDRLTPAELNALAGYVESLR